jgi:hypothetical protein
MANRSAGLVRFLDLQQAQTSAFQPAGSVTLMDVYATVNADRLSGTTLADNVCYSSLTSLGVVTAGTWRATPLTVAYGGTGLTTCAVGDLLYGNGSSSFNTLAGSTSTTRKFLRQTGDGTVSSAPVWDTIQASDVTGSALTVANDTNVTLTLGGAPQAALLGATSVTAGWTGTLSVARGGTGLSATSLGDLLYSDNSNSLATVSGNTSTTKKYLSQTGTGATSAAPAWTTIAASELTGTSLPTAVVSSSLTGLGVVSNLTANRQVVIQSSLTGYPVCQDSFCVDDGQFGAYNGTKFGLTNNNSGYANKMDVLSYTRTGISGSSSAGLGYTILGLRAWIDRYQEDGVTCPRESTLTVSRCFYNGGIGASAQGEAMDLFNNKYAEYPNGTGINYGITLTKVGNDALYREFVINFRCPTRPPSSNTTNVFRILPFCNNYGSGATGLDADKVTSARIRFEVSPVDIVSNPINFVSSTVTSLPVLSISTVTHTLGVADATDLFTGMPIVLDGTGTEAKANIANCISLVGNGLRDQGHLMGAGQISVVSGSTLVTGVNTFFTTQASFQVGAIIAFGQYAYTVASITSSTALNLTENAFATVTSAKWYYSYPPDSAIYPGKLAVGGEYFVIAVDATSIKLATTYHNALKGINIRILQPASGTFYINYKRQTSVLASSALTSNTTFVLPNNAPVNGARLITDASGNTTWSSGSALAVGSDSNVTLTLSGTPSDALLSPVTVAAGWSGTLAVARGGTGLSTTTLGDLLYANSSNALATLAGNTSTVRKFLRQTGDGSVSAAPAWDTLVAADVPGSALTVGNDTNVTLSLGGAPSGALLGACSITAGWTGTLSTARGGTGQSVYTDGQLLIGNTATGQLSKATLIQTSVNQVLITNGNGTITLGLPQGIHPTNSSPQFVSIGLGSAPLTGATLYMNRAQATSANANIYGVLSIAGLSVTGGTTAIAASGSFIDSISVSGTGTATIAANLYAGGNLTTSGTGTISTAAGAYLKPSFTNLAGCTLTAAYGVYVKPLGLTGTAAIPMYAGVYSDTVAATGTVTNGYGGYFKAPTGCTNAVALYADSLNVNVAPLSAPTAGRINCNSLRASGGASGGIIVNNTVLATNATDGFLYLPTCAGVPTGTPTSQTGTVALVYDTTNNNLYVYNGTWKKTTTFA